MLKIEVIIFFFQYMGGRFAYIITDLNKVHIVEELKIFKKLINNKKLILYVERYKYKYYTKDHKDISYNIPARPRNKCQKEVTRPRNSD